MNNLYNYLRDNYRAYLLSLDSDKVIPGMLLKTNWMIPAPFAPPKPQFILENAYAWDVLNRSANPYTSSMHPSEIVVNNVVDSFSFNANLTLPQYGLTLTNALTSNYSATINISSVQMRSFDNSIAHLQLASDLLLLANTDKVRWQWIEDNLLVVEAFYVQSLSAQFKSDGNNTAQADFTAAGLKASAGLTLTWTNSNTITLVGAPTVPFAVRGTRLEEP